MSAPDETRTRIFFNFDSSFATSFPVMAFLGPSFCGLSCIAVVVVVCLLLGDVVPPFSGTDN